MLNLSLKQIIIGVVVVLLVAAGGYQVFTRMSDKKDIDVTQKKLRSVSTARVSDLNEKVQPLSLVGEVTSESQITVRAEAQGSVTAVYVKQGQFVGAGQIVAEIENSRERASVLQARGGVTSAEAGLSIFESQYENAQEALAETRNKAILVSREGFTAADDAVRNKADKLFTDSFTTTPKIIFFIPDSQLEINLETKRFVLEETLVAWQTELNNISLDGNIFAYLDTASTNLSAVRTFLDNAARVVNLASPNADLSQTTIDTWKASISVARNSINGALSAVSVARDNVHTKETAVEIAQRQGSPNGSPFAQGSAAVIQAKGILGVAVASLEKTIIRSPISGTINSLNIDRGDFVSIFQDVAVVANNNTLKISAFITGEDMDYITVGSDVIIDNSKEGRVVEIAPAIDQTTKKAEISIIPTNTNADLTNGETVSLSISRTLVDDADITREFVIPVSAINITPSTTVVFTVDKQNVLIAHDVVFGPLIGDDVIIRFGITPNMEIVLDARGLKEGDEVIVQ